MPFKADGQTFEITGDRSERRIGQQVNSAFQTLVGDALLDRRDQPAAPGAVVGLPQDRIFRRDGTVRSAAAHRKRWTNRHSRKAQRPRRRKSAIQTSASLSVDDRKVLARSTEAKPDAAYGMDERIGVLTVDLAADASDIDVDDVGRGVKMDIPYMLQQHRSGNNLAFVANQVFEELAILAAAGRFSGRRGSLFATPGQARDRRRATPFP